MRGNIRMMKLSYEEQMSAISEILKAEIQNLNSLPADEAKREAHRRLVRVGIIDDNGNYTEPYAALMDQSV